MTDDLLTALARYDSPTLANAIETLDVQSRDVGFADNRIKCIFPELGRMVGYAATATIVARGAPTASIALARKSTTPISISVRSPQWKSRRK